MRIAIVGSGIAGLTASYLLTQHSHHTIDIYERAPQLGMDAHGYDLDIDEINANEKKTENNNEKKKKIRVDVPLRVFTESYYRNMTALYDHVGVKFVPEDYSGSVTSIEGSSFFSYNNFVTRSFNFPYISAWRTLTDPSYRSILHDVIRFHINMRRHLSTGVIHHDGKTISLDTITIGQYFIMERYSYAFQHQFILPIMQGICTCSLSSAASYPAHIVLHYLATQTLYGVKRVDLGTEDVVSRLSAGANVRCNSEIKEIRSHVDKVTGTTTVIITSNDGTSHEYDHVIMATQAHQIIPLVHNPSETLKTALNGFSIEKSQVILHTDTSLMPTQRSEWRAVNFILDSQQSHTSALPTYTSHADPATCWNGKESMATIWMNRVSKHLKDRGVQGHDDVDIFQTWNPIRRPAEDKILCEGNFERPIIGLNTLTSIKQLWNEQGKGNIWYCGSYCLSGVPLLESAVTSAIHVAARFGASPPWQSTTVPVTSSPFTDLCSTPASSSSTSTSESDADSSSSSTHVDPCKLHPSVPLLSPFSPVHLGMCGALACLALMRVFV